MFNIIRDVVVAQQQNITSFEPGRNLLSFSCQRLIKNISTQIVDVISVCFGVHYLYIINGRHESAISTQYSLTSLLGNIDLK